MRIIIVLIASITLGLTSCMKENLTRDGSGGELGKSVQVNLNFNIPSILKPMAQQSRATAGEEGFSVEFFDETSDISTRTSGTTELYNLWLFQFDAAGIIQGVPQKISNQVEMVNDMAILPVTLHVGTNQTLYLVALGKKVTANSELGAVSSMTELENISLDYVENRSGLYYSRITAQSEVPYGGKSAGVTIQEIGTSDQGEIVYGVPDGFVGGIEIKQLMARIQLKHRFDVPANTLEGVRLLKVPSKLFINPDAVASDITNAVAMVDMEGNNALTDADKDADGYFTSQWYVAQNKRGTVPGISSERDRYRKPTDGTGQAPELGTNIEAWSYSNTDRKLYTVHQIYVGNNNTTNFDVEINNHYNLRTIINSSDTKDQRIRSSVALQKIYFASNGRSGKTGGSTVAGGTSVYFDAHYGWRPIIIDAQGRKVSVGIYTDAACTQLVNMNDPVNNWLQLSTYSNYTDVVRNGKEQSLTNRIETTIFLPTHFRLYLYADQYITNQDGSLSKYDLNTDIRKIHHLGNNNYKDQFVKNRVLYLNVVTEDIAAQGTPQTTNMRFTINQQQGYYAGLFGGELKDGQYTKGLIVDVFNEQLSRLDDNYPVSASLPYIHFAYSGVFTNYHWDPSKTPEENYPSFVSGKQTTYNFATNPQNYTVNTSLESKIPNMLKINGKIDLYQYNYFVNFVTRFCFDLNRDKNGNGQIDYYPDDRDENEYEWYAPSSYQALGMRVASGNILIPDNMGTANEQDKTEAPGSSQGSGTGWKSSNTGKGNGWKLPRCVRDITVSDQEKQGTKATVYTETNGTTYAMIDISNLENGILNKTVTDQWNARFEELDLYSYSTTGELYDPLNHKADASKPMGSKVSRMIKNAQMDAYSSIQPYNLAAMFSSPKFIVSPTDVYNDGDSQSNPSSYVLQDADGNPRANSLLMQWAEANGRLNTANSQGLAQTSQATITGCYAYKGKNGTDALGTWRTPTYNELSLILIFAKEMSKLEAQTGFKKLNMQSTAGTYIQKHSYWTSSQSSTSSTEAAAGGLDINYGVSIWDRASKNSQWSDTSARLRCVRDIP